MGAIQPLQPGYVYLGDPSTVALGFDLSAGGAIGSLPFYGTDYIDDTDFGRYIQFSPYDGGDQYSRNKRPSKHGRRRSVFELHHFPRLDVEFGEIILPKDKTGDIWRLPLRLLGQPPGWRTGRANSAGNSKSLRLGNQSNPSGTLVL
jgi:hypothetical protein